MSQPGLWDFLEGRPELTWVGRFQLWVEADAVQLGIELTTYYGLCAVVGLIQGFAYGRIIYGLTR